MNYHETNQGTTATNQQLKQQQVHLHLLGALHPLPFQRFSFVGQSSSLAALPPCQNCLHSHGHVLGGPLPPLQAWPLLHHELSEGCLRPCGQGPCGQGTGTTSQAANQAGCLEDGNHRVPQVIGIYTHSYSTRLHVLGASFFYLAVGSSGSVHCEDHLISTVDPTGVVLHLEVAI